ncbi:MAG: 5'-3' exonuclease, partial [Acidimicrobiales bacterium]
MSDRPNGPLIVLDGMSLAFRAYFALPPELTTKAGTVTNAVHGFTSMLIYLVREHRPGAMAVAFDPPGPTFRDEIHTEYKAGRNATPDELTPQFDMIRTTVASLGIPLVEVPGFEADDVLATLATQARDRACDVILVTGDRDAFQLVEDPHIKVLYNRRGVSDYALYDESGIEERTGVRPEKYAMLAALRGDPSDNIVGVPGVGEKTAAKLLNTYGDIDGIYANLDKCTPKLRSNLAEAQAQVRANLRIIPLVRDVPLDVTVEHLSLGGWDLDTARETFTELELKSTWDRVVPLLRDGTLGPPGPGSSDPAALAVEVANADPYGSVTVGPSLTEAQQLAISERLPALPGVSIARHGVRTYL